MVGDPQISSASCQAGGHKHCGSGDIMFLMCHVMALWQWRYNVLTLPCDPNVMTSSTSGWLISFESTPKDVPTSQI